MEANLKKSSKVKEKKKSNVKKEANLLLIDDQIPIPLCLNELSDEVNKEVSISENSTKDELLRM